MTAIRQTDRGVILTLRVIPRASRTEICGLHEGAVKIRLQAPPVDGKANKALVKMLSKRLKVPAGSIDILSGETGRNKRLLIHGAKADVVQKKLGV